MKLQTRPDPLSPRSAALWFGVLCPPVAWGVHLVMGDLIFELGCSRGAGGRGLFGMSLESWALIETVLVAVVTAAAGAAAYAAWRRLQELPEGTAWSRAHAMAVAGMGSALLYLLLIAYGSVAPLFLNGCGTSLSGT